VAGLDIVIETSAIIAVLIGEPERKLIVSATSGQDLIGPGSIPWEVGNAFTAMMKRGRIEVEEARKGLQIFGRIPLRYIHIDMENVVFIADEFNTYAYDAYFLDCAVRYRAPLLTLDLSMRDAAERLGINLLKMEE